VVTKDTGRIFFSSDSRNKTNRDWILADTNQHELQHIFHLWPYPIFKLSRRSTLAYGVHFKNFKVLSPHSCSQYWRLLGYILFHDCFISVV